MPVRDQFIPVRKTDIVAALTQDPALSRQAAQLVQFCRLLGSIYHFENFAVLERLRDDYFYFNPEIGPQAGIAPQELADKRRELETSLDEVLKKANYAEISHQEIEDAHSARRLLRVKVRAPLDDYHFVRFYERGRHPERIEVRRWLGLRRHVIDTTVFDNVVLVVGVKSLDEIASPRQRRRLQAGSFKPGTILIKSFRNITAGDLYMLLPQVRVVMSLVDQLTIGVPALAGGVPLLLNLLPALTVVGLVAGYYLGLAPELDKDALVKSFGAFTGLAAVVGFILTQRMKYQRRSLLYQKEISDHFYFRNISNNSGIFDALVGSAEEQEFNEAILAYCFLLTAGAPLTQAELDGRIEDWIRSRYDLDLDFEVEDAVAKLERLALLRRDGDRLSVAPLSQSLATLDRTWDGFFPYASEAAAPATA
jgi:hypothetical protein